MRRMPGETTRDLFVPGTQPGGNDDQTDHNFYVVIRGVLEANGKGTTEDAAHRAAEQQYDRVRLSEMVASNEDDREQFLDKVAAVLYAYHQAVVVGGGRGFPPGTPLPHAAPDSTMNHFRAEARLWVGKVEAWDKAVEPTDGAQVRGRESAGFLG